MVSTVSPQAAASAYANSMNAAKMVSSEGGAVQATPDGSSFADMMKQGVTKAIDSIKGGEQMSAKAVTGQADMIDVVQAVTSAELTLQSVVALRDRMISAYQEILRMPI
jgi:flagellar hook-basal body complex protein FliE